MVVPFPTYFQLLLEFVRGCVLAPHYSTLAWTGFWEDVRDQAVVHRLGMSRSLTLILQMMQFAKTLDVLVGALEALNEESEPLGFRVSSVKTRIQAFNDILVAALLSVPICGEDVEVTEKFTYLDSDIHVSAGCEPEVNRRLGRAWGVIDSLDHGVWRCRYLCRRMKVRVFRSLVLPVLLFGCETWTLTKDLR